MTKPLFYFLGLCLISSQAGAHPYGHSDKVPMIDRPPMLSYFQEGVDYYTDHGQSHFLATHCKSNSCRLSNAVTLEQGRGFTGSFGRSFRVVNGRLVPMQEPYRIKAIAKDQLRLDYPKNHAHMLLKFQALDVSGQKIVNYLKNYNHEESALASRINPWAKFPPGSIAFAPTMRLDQDGLIVPNAEVMTAQKSLDKFVATYSGKIPSCLRYEKRAGAQPYAIRFKRHNAQRGQIIIYKADRTNIMCEAVGEPIATGTYQRRRIKGTNVMTFDFPDCIDSRDIGIKTGHSNATEFALIEVTHPKREVLPGRIIYAQRDFQDYQYRFNATASQAINKALKTP